MKVKHLPELICPSFRGSFCLRAMLVFCRLKRSAPEDVIADGGVKSSGRSTPATQHPTAEEVTLCRHKTKGGTNVLDIKGHPCL